jgi:hypothetical protein
MRPRAFAEGTTVPVEKTRMEIERLLTRHGASQLGIVSDTERGAAMVLFSMAGRQVRLRVPLPRLEEAQARRRGAASARERQLVRWEQASRERWRAVLLLVRAKLELIELGLSTIEREFLADIALPNGQTVGDFLHGQLEEAYASGNMPPLLPPPGGS